jgi:hypothetical protein
LLRCPDLPGRAQRNEIFPHPRPGHAEAL